MKKLLAIVLLVCVSQAGAASLFEDETVLEVKLVGPLSSLLEEDNGSEELRFSLHADDVAHSVKVRLRGNSRRRVCDFPPLRINFNADDTAQSVFAGQNKLKLVTHCKKSDSAESGPLMEYAAYRIFNLISDVSYRVRLLRITYSDTDGRLEDSAFDRYAFLIESSSGLADRVAGKRKQLAGVSLRSLNDQQAASVFVFQYLIANTDWSLVTADTDDACCHNGDLFAIGPDLYYVPYDFDLSGLVNARYAKPDPSLRISRVTQRKYRGYCISTEALSDVLIAIKARRVEVLDVISQLPGVSQKGIEAKTEFLEQFFARADNEEKLMKNFERACL